MNKIFASMAFALMTMASQASVMTVASSSSTELTDQNAQQQTALMSKFMAPILYKVDGNHERLFIAVFDCSWKHAKNGPTEPTTVQLLYDQLRATENKWHGQIHAEYVGTDCARDNWYAQPDQGKSIFDARMEQMYQRLGTQVEQWLKQDPEAQIRLLDLGGSWGALQAAGFSHVVDRQGIRISAKSSKASVASDGLLIAAGKTAQAVALLDPVGAVTNDVRLPPSVISGIQFTAVDEHRGLFKSDRIIKPGITPEGRLAGIYVPGAHSDACGGYKLNGLSIRTGNLVIGYINGLADHPLLQKQAEPTDPRLNVIHHSEDEETSIAPPAPDNGTMVDRALSASARGDNAEALRIWEQLGNQGDKNAMTEAGVVYQHGTGVPVNYNKALDWYLKAMNGDALNNMGVMYRDGTGVPKNRKIAYLLFLTVHMQGMGNEEGIMRANRNLQREIDEQSKKDTGEALCYTADYVEVYVKSRGTLVGIPADLRASPGHPRIKELDWWSKDEIAPYKCPAGT